MQAEYIKSTMRLNTAVKKMKFWIVPASLLGTLAMPLNDARAQTGVTLFGLIDQGINFTNNAQARNIIELQSGFLQGARFGLKGVEDLGRGATAVFMLENGFNASSGAAMQGGRVFGRQAYVGLSSPAFGTVTFGRQYDSIVDYLGPLTANGSWAGFLMAHPFDNDNTDNSFRLNNAIKYASPTYNGLTLGALYGFGNQAGSGAASRAYSFGAQYVRSAITVAAAFMQINDGGNKQNGSLAADDANFFASNQNVWGAGISYAVGSATIVALSYTRTDLSDPQRSIYFGRFVNRVNSLKFDNFEFNVKWQLTPTAFSGLMYNYTSASFDSSVGDSFPHWHQLGIIGGYKMSSRTDVYAQASYQRLSGNSPGMAPIDTAMLTGASATSSSATQFIARVGIRHSF